jgi:hypothetical protein
MATVNEPVELDLEPKLKKGKVLLDPLLGSFQHEKSIEVDSRFVYLITL